MKDINKKTLCSRRQCRNEGLFAT